MSNLLLRSVCVCVSLPVDGSVCVLRVHSFLFFLSLFVCLFVCFCLLWVIEWVSVCCCWPPSVDSTEESRVRVEWMRVVGGVGGELAVDVPSADKESAIRRAESTDADGNGHEKCQSSQSSTSERLPPPQRESINTLTWLFRSVSLVNPTSITSSSLTKRHRARAHTHTHTHTHAQIQTRETNEIKEVIGALTGAP